MKRPAPHLALKWMRDDLGAWENEGGAVRTLSKVHPNAIAAHAWTPASVMDPAPAGLRGADKGITDAKSLAILQISLLLLVPALGGVALFWSAAAITGPQ